MDPQAVLRELLYALEQGDRDNAHAACESLAEWIKRGGFLPIVETLEATRADPRVTVAI